MSVNPDGDSSLPRYTEAYYETLHRQEEIYLQAREEELHLIVDSYVPTPAPNRSTIRPNDSVALPENLDQLLNEAAKELIVVDANGRSLSKELWEMLKLI